MPHNLKVEVEFCYLFIEEETRINETWGWGDGGVERKELNFPGGEKLNNILKLKYRYVKSWRYIEKHGFISSAIV